MRVTPPVDVGRHSDSDPAGEPRTLAICGGDVDLRSPLRIARWDGLNRKGSVILGFPSCAVPPMLRVRPQREFATP